MQQKLMGSGLWIVCLGAGMLVGGCGNQTTETASGGTNQAKTAVAPQGLKTVTINVQGMH